MTHSPDPETLREAIDKAKVKHEPGSKDPASSGASKSFQVGVELLAGVAVGAFLGLSADRWLEISPFGLLIGFGLGMAAAWRNIMRLSKQAEEKL